VTKYRFAKVDYTSVEDSQLTTDFLRMNPSFHSRERYDCALFNAVDGKYLIGRIISILGLLDNSDTERQYALIIPFDLRLSRSPQERLNHERAAHLRFTTLRSRRAKDSMVVPIESIVRGALMVPDWGSGAQDQYIVMDVVDADFFLRMRLQGLGDSLICDTVL
jgi:hypothetical protein